jgi:hypothetical protein
VPPDPSELDLAVYRLVLDALASYGDAAAVERVWSDGGGMWFTEVSPRTPGAARLSVAAEDESTLNVTIGNVWFEIYGPVPENLPKLRGMVEAVFAGRFEEAGSTARAHGRLYTASGTARVGHMSLPWPWRWRQRRRYSAYSA